LIWSYWKNAKTICKSCNGRNKEKRMLKKIKIWREFKHRQATVRYRWEVRKILLEAKVHNRLRAWEGEGEGEGGVGEDKGEEECVIAMDYYIYYISNVWYSDNMHEQVFTMRVSPCGWLNLFCPIIFKIVTNSTEHTLSWDSDMAHKQLVNRSLTPFDDTRKLITVVKVAHQWVLAEPQKSCTYFRVFSKRLMLCPVWDDCIFHLRCLSGLIGLNYTYIIRERQKRLGRWRKHKQLLDDLKQCFSTFARLLPGKFCFYKTRARSPQIYS